MKSLFQTNVMFHDSFKQRQTRTHKAVFHFKTGKFVQPNPQQTISPPNAGGPANRAVQHVARASGCFILE
ncbi:hypothetical protein CWG12_02720 [Salmonella enterica]|nr:hypothetical protein [Salmonella enterica]